VCCSEPDDAAAVRALLRAVDVAPAAAAAAQHAHQRLAAANSALWVARDAARMTCETEVVALQPSPFLPAAVARISLRCPPQAQWPAGWLRTTGFCIAGLI
jgi:hypothetical protein